MARKAYKYRLSPNVETVNTLNWTLTRCRELYNAALSERKDAYQKHFRQTVYQNEQGKVVIAQMEANLKVHDVSYYQQKRDLVAIKELREEYRDIASHVLQDVILRLERAMQNFFRRLQEGQTPGFPRFQGRNRYNSFTYPDGAGWKLDGNLLHLTKIGTCKVKLHREIQGTIKTLTIKREVDQWYAVFSCEIIDEQVGTHTSYTDDAIGIDLGLTHFATLSTGDTIENPRYYRCGEAKLQATQKRLARCQKGSHRREKVKRQIGKAHRKIRNQRCDFLHKQSRQLVNTYEVIVLEDVQAENMSHVPQPKKDEQGKSVPNGAAAKGGLNKSIRDAGWGMFVSMCQRKAAEAGVVTVLTVDPKYTSQVCSRCGTVKKKALDECWHRCPCGCELDRDHNAAINILARGLQQWHSNITQAGTQPTLATA